MDDSSRVLEFSPTYRDPVLFTFGNQIYMSTRQFIFRFLEPIKKQIERFEMQARLIKKQIERFVSRFRIENRKLLFRITKLLDSLFQTITLFYF